MEIKASGNIMRMEDIPTKIDFPLTDNIMVDYCPMPIFQQSSMKKKWHGFLAANIVAITIGILTWIILTCQ